MHLIFFQAAGKYHQRGRTYVVEDGDIIFFKFNTGGLKKKWEWLMLVILVYFYVHITTVFICTHLWCPKLTSKLPCPPYLDGNWLLLSFSIFKRNLVKYPSSTEVDVKSYLVLYVIFIFIFVTFQYFAFGLEP